MMIAITAPKRKYLRPCSDILTPLRPPDRRVQ
jgi:hypothetical protein